MKTRKLIGHAGELLGLLSVTLPKRDRIKLLFGGASGIGKTELSTAIAEQLCGGRWGVESYLGREVTIHTVKTWRENFATSNLFGSGWRCVVVNEIDTCQRDALDLMLDLLDKLPAGRGIIGTTNEPFVNLAERFRSRFSRYEVRAPEVAEIEALLAEETALPAAIARQIAALSGGNVRQALEDADAWACQNPAPKSQPIEWQPSLAAMGF